MTKAPELSETEAIKLVIADGIAMDYIDVVDVVEKRYRIKTSSAKVEQVHHDMVKSRTDAKENLKPRLSLEMASQLLTGAAQEKATAKTIPTGDSPPDPMTLALQFVKSVGGLKQAKRALAELEDVLRD